MFIIISELCVVKGIEKTITQVYLKNCFSISWFRTHQGLLPLLSDYSAFLSHGVGRHSSCLQSSTKREATAEREVTMKETIKLFHLMVVF